MADVPHFLLLLTAREDHTWFDHRAAAKNSARGRRHSSPAAGAVVCLRAFERRWWQRQNRLKWRHFIPALTPCCEHVRRGGRGLGYAGEL
jgi:hypothetical protein